MRERSKPAQLDLKRHPEKEFAVEGKFENI